MRVNILKRGPSRGGVLSACYLQVLMFKAFTAYFGNAQAKPVIITVLVAKPRTQWNSQYS